MKTVLVALCLITLSLITQPLSAQSATKKLTLFVESARNNVENSIEVNVEIDSTKMTMKVETIGIDRILTTLPLEIKQDPSSGGYTYTGQIQQPRERLHVSIHENPHSDGQNAPRFTGTYRRGFGWCGTSDTVLELSSHLKLNLDVKSSEYNYNKVDHLLVIIDKNEMLMKVHSYGTEDEEIVLKISAISIDKSSGIIHYAANYNSKIPDGAVGISKRVHLSINDHRIAKIDKPFDGILRSGYGFCGTGDTVLNLEERALQ